mmetsp:Transcript_3333/g.7438  ORF Transcript_3333/g.7438 Transcript_3333/m.7438 type:complete len:438 (+) Transcript_3333:362-1675(+)
MLSQHHYSYLILLFFVSAILLLRPACALDNRPKQSSLLGPTVILDPVHVPRRYLEHVPLPQKVPLRRPRVELPILPARVGDRELHRIFLAVAHVEHLGAEAHPLRVLDAAGRQDNVAGDVTGEQIVAIGGNVERLGCEPHHLRLARSSGGREGQLGEGSIVESADDLDVRGRFEGLAPHRSGFAAADAVPLPEGPVVERRPGAFRIVVVAALVGSPLPLGKLPLLLLLVRSGQRVHHPRHHRHVPHGLPQQSLLVLRLVYQLFVLPELQRLEPGATRTTQVGTAGSLRFLPRGVFLLVVGDGHGLEAAIARGDAGGGPRGRGPVDARLLLFLLLLPFRFLAVEDGLGRGCGRGVLSRASVLGPFLLGRFLRVVVRFFRFLFVGGRGSFRRSTLFAAVAARLAFSGELALVAFVALAALSRFIADLTLVALVAMIALA